MGGGTGSPGSGAAGSRPDLTWPDVLTGLVSGQDLRRDQASWAMNEVLQGNATTAQIAGFAVALRAKGETVEELAGLAEVMLSLATPIDLDRDAVDVVGTGGDRKNTVNISTMAAIVAAAAGAQVVKHGNRSASSSCGTADVLERLGVALDVPPAAQAGVLDAAGIVFLFAPKYHSSLRHAAGTRSELGISTTFNFLGPLANPGRPRAQAVGVADPRMAPLMAGVIAGRGARGMVFHGGDGLDELTITTNSSVWLIGDGAVHQTSFDPAELGIARCEVADLVGGAPDLNAQIVRDTLGGKPGPVREVVTLNAAAALLAFRGPGLDRALGEQLREPLAQAREAIDRGEALRTVERWAQASQQALG